MNKKDYFLQAVHSGQVLWVPWIMNAFALVQYDTLPEEIGFPRLKWGPSGHMVVFEDGRTEPLEGAGGDDPAYHEDDQLPLKAGELSYLKTDITTTYGILLVNAVCIGHGLQGKFDYINGRFEPDKIEEKVIASRMPELKDGEVKDPKGIYLEDYKRYVQAAYDLTAVSQIFVWAATEKNVLPPEGLEAFKADLFKRYKGREGDALAIAEMEKEVIAFDAKWREGDPGNNFLISKKAVNVLRKRNVLMYGAEVGADGNSSKMHLIKNSLMERYGPDDFAAVSSVQRLGSFGRGSDTVRGGVVVKGLFRVTGNLFSVPGDCGSKLTIPRLVSKENLGNIVGFTALIGKEQRRIKDAADAEQYLGQYLNMRSPAYCLTPGTGRCLTCLGPRMEATPNGLATACANVGSIFMLVSMGAAHSSGLNTVQLDLATDMT